MHKVTLEIDNEGIMIWKGREELPPKVFDILEDALACFPRGTKMEIDYPNDCFSLFEFPQI